MCWGDPFCSQRDGALANASGILSRRNLTWDAQITRRSYSFECQAHWLSPCITNLSVAERNWHPSFHYYWGLASTWSLCWTCMFLQMRCSARALGCSCARIVAYWRLWPEEAVLVTFTLSPSWSRRTLDHQHTSRQRLASCSLKWLRSSQPSQGYRSRQSS